MAQWTLTDNSSGSPVVFTFPVNPNEFTPPERIATVGVTLGTAPNGIAVVMQGRDQLRRGSMSGGVNSETFYNNLRTETDKNYPLVLTDDQGTVFDILVTGVKWNRLRRANNQWRYNYTISYIEVT